MEQRTVEGILHPIYRAPGSDITQACALSTSLPETGRLRACALGCSKSLFRAQVQLAVAVLLLLTCDTHSTADYWILCQTKRPLRLGTHHGLINRR